MKFILNLIFIFCVTSCYSQDLTKVVELENELKIRNEPSEYPWKLKLPLVSPSEFKIPKSCNEASEIIKRAFDTDFSDLIKTANKRASISYIKKNSVLTTEDDLELFLNKLNEAIDDKYGIIYYEFYLNNAIEYIYKAWKVESLNMSCSDGDISLKAEYQFDMFVINILAVD